MPELVTYAADGPLATITLDDGKANALSPVTQAALHRALDRAEADGAVVLLQGRPGVFSGGFDLSVFRDRGPDATTMLQGGFDLAERLLTFPRPVVAVCTGHAIAMGVFVLLSTDYRLGADGPFRITANEVAIGMTVPRAAIEILRQRLTPAAFQRAAVLAGVFTPTEAVAAGFLDRVVAADGLAAAAVEVGTGLAALDARAHAATKARVRASSLESFRRALAADRPDFAAAAG
jgi:enoyl-CoA hydratase